MIDIPFGRPDITDVDREAVMRVLNGHILTHGPECKAFETEFSSFLGAGANSVTVSSCMAALHLAYLHMKLGPGDEVIAPACTHVATVHAIEWVGAKPVLVDPDPATGNLTAKGIEAAITPRTKAVGLVHFVGIPCEMDEIVELCERKNLALVEDCAIAIGARYKGKHVGLFGDYGTFSFYPVKHITTGEGGMFLSRNAELAAQISRLRAFGVDRTHSERSIPGMYEVPTLGLNYRMSEMQAALGRTQTAKLGKLLDARKANFTALKHELSTVDNVRILDSQHAHAVNSHYCAVLVLEGKFARQRNEIIGDLNARGIGTSIYYPQPVPRMKYYRDKYGYDGDAFPNATEISDCGIALPVGPHLGAGEMKQIGDAVKAVLAAR